jgi:hypothetical protein
MDKLISVLTSKLTIFVASLIGTDVAIGGWVYYITPYHKHFLMPAATVFDAQPVIAYLCAVVAIVCLVAAIMTRPRANS